MPSGMIIAVAVVLIIAAAVISHFVTVSNLKKNAESKIGNAETKAREIIDDAVKTAEAKKKESLLEIKEESIKNKNELEKESTIISHNSYTLLMQDYNILIEALFKLIKPDHIDILRKQLLAAKRIYIVGLDQNRNVAELATNKFTLLGMDVQAITTRDALKFRASLATQEELFIIITFSGNRHALAEALGEIIQNDSFIALISNYEKSICSAYADIVFLIPKTNSLKNNDTITREIFILMLFDIIFLNFLNEDSKSLEMFQKIAPFAQKSRMEDE